MTDQRLELMLHELAVEIDLPATPDLASVVRSRLEREAPGATPRPRARWLRPVVAAAAVTVAIAGALTFSPAARRAAADLLGIVGIHITVGEGDVPAGTPDLSAVDLGDPVSTTRAEAIVGFTVKGPDTGRQPYRTYLDRSIGDTGMVSTVFYRSDERDRIAYLITEFRASVEEGFFKKVSGTDGEVRFVSVNGGRGYWLTGEPHLFYYVGADGETREESVRVAGKVLLWEADGITYRIEGARDLTEALAIADRLG